MGGRWQESKVYFLPGTFYANIKSAWESAEVNGTIQSAHCQGIIKKKQWMLNGGSAKISILSHLAEMSQITCFVTFWLKCCDLRALSHLD